MARTTFWDIIERTIEKVGTPLSAKEIWDKANELGTIGDYVTTGKTPHAGVRQFCKRTRDKLNSLYFLT